MRLGMDMKKVSIQVAVYFAGQYLRLRVPSLKVCLQLREEEAKGTTVSRV
jgi:hypothetical protein